MTMHEWSELVLDVSASRKSVIAGTQKAGMMKLSLDLHAELCKDGVQPNITAFNRLISNNHGSDFDLTFKHVEIDDDSRFQQNMSLFACMEQEPLNLKPNEQTFELAMISLFSKARMATLTEALFQLMQTPAYGLQPTLLCWVFRVAAVLTRSPSVAAEQYYEELKSKYPLDRYSASALLRAAILRRAWNFLYDTLLPDVDALSSKFSLDMESLVKMLSWPLICSTDGIPLLRWILERDLLNQGSRAHFTEPLCLRWLSWIASPEIGAGVSDIAEAAMQRIIDIRKDGVIPRRVLETFLQIMEVEESGVVGEIARFRPSYCIPVTLRASSLATHIREQLRAHQAQQLLLN